MQGFKMMRRMKDGYAPLFIHKRNRFQIGEWLIAEWTRDIPKEYAYRPGFHICSKPFAPHLKLREPRVWMIVEFEPRESIRRPESQGGLWYLADYMKMLGEMDELYPETTMASDVQTAVDDAGLESQGCFACG